MFIFFLSRNRQLAVENVATKVGDFIPLKKEVVLIMDKATGLAAPEVVVKGVLNEHGQESCTVGFLPRHIAMCPLISARHDGAE